MSRNKNIPVHSAKKFTWTGNRGVIEASSLAGGHARVWNDSIDVGFIVRSNRTGVELLFTNGGEEIDGEESDGEVTGWVYRSNRDGIVIHVINT